MHGASFTGTGFGSLRDKAQDYSLNSAQDTEGFRQKLAPNSIAKDLQVV